jgi:hypothetical protein
MTEELKMRPDGLATCKLSFDHVAKSVITISEHLIANHLLHRLSDAILLKLTFPVTDLDVYEIRHVCKQTDKCRLVRICFLMLFHDLQTPDLFCRFDQTTLPLWSQTTFLNYTPDSSVSKFFIVLEIFFVIHIVEIVLVVVTVNIVYNPLLVFAPEI